MLDEPTIGLHPRDNRILLNALQTLSDKGNTLVVVEHDEDTIRHADHLIDIGPGAGKRGGALVAQGSRGRPVGQRRLGDRAASWPIRCSTRCSRAGAVDPAAPALHLRGATLHNLQQRGRGRPLHRLVAVTGVSGSGKSTLARDVLLANLQLITRPRRRKPRLAAACDGIDGWQAHRPRARGRPDADRQDAALLPGHLHRLLGRDPQALHRDAGGQGARLRGGRFSFNTGDGRCRACEGQGLRTIEMSFLPDVKVPCETCHGQRFNAETLAVSWRGKSIGEVLQMEVDEAVEFFASMPSIAHPLQLLKDVGLGYLTLGQPSPDAVAAARRSASSW